MEKVHPWCGQPPDPGWLKNRLYYSLIFTPRSRKHRRDTITPAAWPGYTTPLNW